MIVSFTINETLKWLSSLPILMPAGLLTGGDSVSSDIYLIPLPPPPPVPLLPVPNKPNKPYSFCGR